MISSSILSSYCDVIWYDMIWYDMKWSEVKWSEVKWSEVKWGEVRWGEVRQGEVNRTATKVIIRPPPSILSWIFFFFLFLFFLFSFPFLSFPFLSFPFTHLPSIQSSQLPQTNPGCPQEQGISKPYPVRVLELQAKWYDILLSLSLSSLSLLFSSFPLSPSLVLLTPTSKSGYPIKSRLR